MRILYSVVWWLALPLVLLRLWWRGRREHGYRQHVLERLGVYSKVATNYRPLIWIHAVSVGETRAAEPLVNALLAEYPGHDILLTHMTATGRATGKTLFGELASRVVQCYLPYDTGWMMSRFLQHFSPRLCILMETEIWPNLIAQCVSRGIKVVLVSARMSERSLARARFAAQLMTDAASSISFVAAQTYADRDRLLRYGARNVQVTGSVKFDVMPSDASIVLGSFLRARFGERPILLCASTREGEEAMILDALPLLNIQGVLLVIVPRHPQRFDDVAQMIAARGLSMRRRSELSEDDVVSKDVRVVLGDSMGEMFAYYAAADVAFIGGSLLPLGGQNLIEACAMGKPVLVGNHTFNFGAITEDAVASGAAIRVQNAAELMHHANRLLSDTGLCNDMSRKSLALAQQQRGATERTMSLLRPLLSRH
jgi:3-deoxy-D-manno-octulosonic-acid transferase